MIKENKDKVEAMAITNRKVEIHAELDSLDKEKNNADREGNTVLFDEIESQRQTLISELRDLLK
jgi:hypothetical protein